MAPVSPLPDKSDFDMMRAARRSRCRSADVRLRTRLWSLANGNFVANFRPVSGEYSAFSRSHWALLRPHPAGD